MSRHFRRIPTGASERESAGDIADRILSGTEGEQITSEWTAAQALVHALRATAVADTAQENERETVAAIASIVRSADAPKKYRSRILRGTLSPVVVAVGLFVGGTIAAAATGSLPAPIQRVASRVMAHVGIDLPTPAVAPDRVSVPPRAPDSSTHCRPATPSCLLATHQPTARRGPALSPGKRSPESHHRATHGSGGVKKKSGATHGSGGVKKKSGATHGSGGVKKKSGATHGSGGGKSTNPPSGGGGGSGGGKSTNPPSGGGGGSGGGKSTNPPSGGGGGSGGGKSTNPPSGGGGGKKGS